MAAKKKRIVKKKVVRKKKRATKKRPAKKRTARKKPAGKKTVTTVKGTTTKTVVVNPSTRKRQVQAAINRFTGFRGDPPAAIEHITLQPIDPVMLTMGNLLGVIYETVRDGKQEKYIHKFKKSARPLLCVSSDGLQLYLIGGSYSVTDRGIEDA